MNAKAILFSRVLPQLKAASPYFTTAAIARQVKELGLEISEGTDEFGDGLGIKRHWLAQAGIPAATGVASLR